MKHSTRDRVLDPDRSSKSDQDDSDTQWCNLRVGGQQIKRFVGCCTQVLSVDNMIGRIIHTNRLNRVTILIPFGQRGVCGAWIYGFCHIQTLVLCAFAVLPWCVHLPGVLTLNKIHRIVVDQTLPITVPSDSVGQVAPSPSACQR